MRPSDYTVIDSAIHDWVAAAGLKKLFTSWAGEPARFCYTSSEQGECVQISIEAPEGDNVTIHVRSVESVDDGELHMKWVVGVADVRQALDIALGVARKWFQRRSDD